MANCKAVKWITADKITMLRGWGRDGLTDLEISKKMRISRVTFYQWIKKYPEIREAIESGRELADYKAEDYLYRRITGYDILVPKHYKVKETEYDKNGKKKYEKEKIVEVQEKIHIPSDTTAIIYWLKCRKNKKWNDKKVDITTNDVEDLTTLADLLNFKGK